MLIPKFSKFSNAAPRICNIHSKHLAPTAKKREVDTKESNERKKYARFLNSRLSTRALYTPQIHLTTKLKIKQNQKQNPQPSPR